jgi:hypothetical protein
MFGFSLPKLIFTALIIGVALYGFKYLGRGSKSNDNDDVPGDTVRCTICDEFVVSEAAQDCGKSGCPHGSR